MHDPRSTHWIVLKRILHSIKGTITHGLHFRKGPLQFTAYSDANWAKDPDDRRSTSGYAIFFFLSNLISWNAKKQSIVLRSRTKFEYRSLALTAAGLSWIRMVMKELKIPPLIYCDNIIAIALASNPVYHARMKHVEVDYHFIREKVIRGDIQIRFDGTIDQLADIFTKGLNTVGFHQLMTKLHIIARPLS